MVRQIRMGMLTLELGSDFECPHCKSGHDVLHWQNEYNNPERGLFNVSCTMCSKPFQIEVSLKISASQIGRAHV